MQPLLVTAVLVLAWLALKPARRVDVPIVVPWNPYQGPLNIELDGLSVTCGLQSYSVDATYGALMRLHMDLVCHNAPG